MIIGLPDGRSVDVAGVDDYKEARQKAYNWYLKNKSATTLGEDDAWSFGDMLSGVGAGAVGAVEGAVSLPAELYDYLADNEEDSAAQSVRDFFSEYKPEVHTGAGEAVKFISQFAIPGLGAVKAARAISGVGRLKKRVEIPTFAAADVLATTPDVETLGDFFDGGPTQRVDTEGLFGAEKALAGLGNRLKVAGEGAGVLLGVPAAFKGITLGGKKIPGLIGGGGMLLDLAGKTKLPQTLARKLIKDPDAPFSAVGINPDLNNPEYLKRNLWNRAKKFSREKLTWSGDLYDQNIKQLEALKIQHVRADHTLAVDAVNEFRDGIKALNNAGNYNDFNESSAIKAFYQYMFGDPEKILEHRLKGLQGDDLREAVRASNLEAQAGAEEILKGLDSRIGETKTLFGKKRKLSLLDSARNLKERISSLGEEFADESTFLDAAKDEALIKTIKSNLGFYGTRIYRAFKDPEGYVPTQQQLDRAIDELVGGVEEVSEAGGKIVERTINQERAVEILNELRTNKSFRNANMQSKFQFDDAVLSGVGNGILKGRTLDTMPAVRNFLGEYTGAPELIGVTKNADGTFKGVSVGKTTLEDQRLGLETKIIETISTVSNATNKQQFFRNLDDYNNNVLDVGRRIFYDDIPTNLPPEQVGKYQRIGMEGMRSGTEIPDAVRQKYGVLAGKYVHEDMLRAFEDVPKGFLDTAHLQSSLWASFLGLKGVSQVVKTVYSPITQIRNATTAAFFALANGNIGKGKHLTDSIKTVFNKIGRDTGVDRGTRSGLDAYYEDKIKLGLINTQSQLGEVNSIIQDALTSEGGMFLRKGGFQRKTLEWVQGNQNRFSGKVYQGSDDVWKLYSYEMELGRLKNVLGKNPNAVIPATDVENILMLGRNRNISDLTSTELESFLKREAASVVKDTVPNYARVPEYIKTLRRLPLGNFVAFPAEIMRTSTNSIGRAIKEIASESPELRSIGMRRLMGAMTVHSALPTGLGMGANLLLGSDDEQVQAYKRSFAQEWERNSVLIPMNTDKNGNIKELYNFSYTNPYDFATRPLRAVFNAVQNGLTNEKDLGDIAMDASWESMREFFGPFLSESIMTEKIMDVLRNTNAYGGNLWGDADPIGTRVAKGFAHFADGLTPGVLPFELEGTSGEGFWDSLEPRVRDFPKAVGLAFGADPMTGVNRRGVRLDPAGKFVEALSGLKTIRPNIKETLKYRGYDAASQVRAASGIFNRLAKRSGNVDAEELTKAFLTSNEQRFKALRDLDMAVDDARTLGLSTSEIATSLKAAKTPNLNYVLAGKFKTFWPSKETINEAYRSSESKLKNPFDWNAMNEITTRMQGTPLRPEAAAREAEAMQQAQQQPAPVQPPAAPPQAAPPIPAPTPTASLSNRPSGLQALREAELQKLLGL